MTLSREHIVARLESLRPALETKYNVRIFGLFGSRARNDARSDSDIDVAYRWASKERGTLFDLGGVWTEINAEFGLDVSLVDWDHVDEFVKARAEKDLLTFYG